MNKQIIRELFHKYLNDECSPAEAERLMDLLNTPENKEIEKELVMLQLLRDLAPAGYTDPALKDQLDGKLRHILQRIRTEPDSTPKPISRYWLRAAAAASIILLLGTSGYLFFSKSTPKTAIQEKKIATDLPPGGNKAVLTLGNGKKIILDSMRNGVLVKEGNVNVMKLANGRLAYKSPDEKPGEITYNTLTTPAGGQYQLVLPDGSKVWLDAASSITYPTAFTGTERSVKITGQAYFEIATLRRSTGEKLPFIVQKDAVSVRVLGTHFNVNAYEDENAIKTTLLEGSVIISRGATETKLSPGQQVQVARNGEFRLIRNADTEEAIAWKNGFFQFNRCDLQAVMRQLARWYNVEVVYQGKIPDHQFGGKMGRDLNLSEVLEGLEKSLVHFKIENKKLIVMP